MERWKSTYVARIEYLGNYQWAVHWDKINGIIVCETQEDAVIIREKIREGLL